MTELTFTRRTGAMFFFGFQEEKEKLFAFEREKKKEFQTCVVYGAPGNDDEKNR